jgi:acetolactate synthase-1/2/3 large subunit
LPADHRLAFARACSAAFKGADLVIIAGTPLDFRVGFGDFGEAKVVHLDSHPDLIADHVDLHAWLGASLSESLGTIADALEKPAESKQWLEQLRSVEESKRADDAGAMHSDTRPIHPLRVYGELSEVLDRDAIVVGDGGDFVSYAGRVVASYEGGCWLDPGPFGCLGAGPGYALAARLAHPGRQVVLVLGDGALGFSGTELETFARLGLPIVVIVGNNGIWALEKHPMQAVYGYDVAADLQPGLRYEAMLEAFGGRGETVAEPGEIKGALQRAFDDGGPYMVNVLTDPGVAYPRSANLA